MKECRELDRHSAAGMQDYMLSLAKARSLELLIGKLPSGT